MLGKLNDYCSLILFYFKQIFFTSQNFVTLICLFFVSESYLRGVDVCRISEGVISLGEPVLLIPVHGLVSETIAMADTNLATVSWLPFGRGPPHRGTVFFSRDFSASSFLDICTR